MQNRLAKLKPGEDVGIFAYQLPSRPAPTMPAPLPKHLQPAAAATEDLQEEEEESEDKAEESEEEGEVEGDSSDEEGDGLPEGGWVLKKNRGKLQLANTEDTTLEPLTLPNTENKKAKWEIFSDKNGLDMLWQGKASEEEFDSIACWEYYSDCNSAVAQAQIGGGQPQAPLKEMTGGKGDAGSMKTPKDNKKGENERGAFELPSLSHKRN